MDTRRQVEVRLGGGNAFRRDFSTIPRSCYNSFWGTECEASPPLFSPLSPLPSPLSPLPSPTFALPSSFLSTLSPILLNGSVNDMKTHLLIATTLFCAFAFIGSAAFADDSLQAAREAGLAKSRFLAPSPKGADERGPSTSRTNSLPQPDTAAFNTLVRPVLAKSCLGCHGPKVAEGRLRVDQLNPDLLAGADVHRWREIYNVLSNSEMPPDGESDYALADADRGRIVDWLSEELNKASKIRRHNRQHSSFRRLTNYEYDNALQDLLGLPYSHADKLPPEPVSADGFKNSSALLQMSAMQLNTYRDIARKALQRAIVIGPRPTPVTYVISMPDEMDKAVSSKKAKTFDIDDKGSRGQRNRAHLFNRESRVGVSYSNGKPLPLSVTKPRPSAHSPPLPDASSVILALPRSAELKLNLDRFLPDEGVMRVRIRARRSTRNPDEFASLRLIFSAHTSNNANFSQVISARDMPVTAGEDAPEFVDFNIQLGDIQRNPFRKLTTTFPRRDEFLHIRNVANSAGRDEPFLVLIDHIEIVAPFYEQWPPRTHTAIFFACEYSKDESRYGREVLKRFLNRVWRRPPTRQELDQWMTLFHKHRQDFSSFEEGMLEVLATALASPEFLYLVQRGAEQESGQGGGDGSGLVADLELASRLSIFLWSSIPDDELLGLAERGQLSDPAILRGQVERMLKDSRSSRFTHNFVQQWLGLDGMESVTHLTDEALRESMREEPVAFFEDVLKRNGSILDFIHSEYAVVNERLAAHYRLPAVYGPHFRRVPIDANSHRGGLLTGAAVLAMNSDGKDSHPLKRGIWMLKRILNDPPPPPPPNVPEVDLTDPEILKMTLKERIADHRDKAACRSCHARIDPWGIAFENYDALGAFRTQIQNKPVDATADLFNKQTLNGMDGLKQYLLSERQDQFARSMVHKLTAYGLGRPLSFGDRAAIDELTTQLRRKGDGLADLVQLIIHSRIFHSH